jgi:signal transduction histidine kinase
MIIAITLLGVLTCLFLLVICLLWADIHRVTRELREAAHTNALITSFTAFPPIKALTAAANVFVHQAQDSEHRRRQQETEVQHMLTNLTHDIKTPLTVASGYVQVLSHDNQDPRLAKVLRNLDSVNDYLRYLLNYTLLQEKTNQLSLSRVNMTFLVTNALISNYDALMAKGLTVTPDLAPDVTLITDRTIMNRVVQNLIGNWLKYADGDLQVKLYATGQQLHMVFSNHSRTPLAPRGELENRFATGDHARTDNSVGLGLNIVHDLLAAVDGSLALSGDVYQFVAIVTVPLNKSQD